MKHIFTIIFSLLTLAVAAQPQQTATGRVELNDGRFVIESFTVKMVGDSLRVELGDLKIINGNSPTVHHFSVPAIFSVPINTHTVRRSVDPSQYAGQMKVSVLELAEKDDELFMDIEVNLAGDVMNRRLSYLLIPELAGQGAKATGAGLLVNGWGKDQLYRRRLKFRNSTLMENLPEIKIAVTRYTDTLVRYNLSMPYQQWMDDAVLDLHQVVGSPAGKEQLYTIANAARVKLQPREPYVVAPKISLVMPEREQKNRRIRGQAFLDFPLGRSVIQPGYRNNQEELAKIETTIRGIQSDPDMNINEMFVEGYASPDGSYAVNERLARERSYALSSYISNTYGIPDNIIRTSSVAEDWEGFRILVEESSMPRREDILAIIDLNEDPDRKEQRLKVVGAWYSIVNVIFPQLRRVEYQIDFTVKDYTLEESRELVARNPELLSQRELFVLAQTYEYGSSQWEQLFETIIRLYPDNQTAMVNYAGILLERGELIAAKRYLDRVADHPQALNNIGIYWMLMDDLDTAEQYLQRASAAGVAEADHNLEEVSRKRENNILMERYRR